MTEIKSFEDHMKEPIRKIVEAIRNEGSHPEYHNEIIELFSEKWPILWEALEELLDANDELSGSSFKDSPDA